MDFSFEVNGVKYIFEYAHPEPLICKHIGNTLIAFPNDFVIVDLETTGFSPRDDEIIEIACVRVRDFKVVDTFTTLVKPKYDLDLFITDLTGITEEMLENAPEIETIMLTRLVSRESFIRIYIVGVYILSLITLI